MNLNVKTAFIVGTGRCGTTWLGQMLNSHSDLCVPPEIQLLFEYSGNGNRLFEYFFETSQADIRGRDLASIIEAGCPYRLEEFFDYKGYCYRQDIPRNSFVEFVTAFYSEIAKSYGKSWLIEQTPWYGSRLDLLSSFFPKAKIIHMVRDGRDVALSFARTPWWHASPRLNLARWQRELKKIAVDAALYFDKDTFLEVKYEDVVTDTEGQIKRICKFLGVEYQPKMLAPQSFVDYDMLCKFDMQQVSSEPYRAWRQRKAAAVFPESLNAWRRHEDVFPRPFPEEIAHWLARYGYELGLEKERGSSADFEYSFNALEPLCLSQGERILALEVSLQDQIAHTEFVVEDWAARGTELEKLSQAIEALCRSLQESTALGERVTQDWAERGLALEQAAEANATLSGLLQKQAADTERIAVDWMARGVELEQARQADAVLRKALQERTAETERIVKDWAARGAELEQVGEVNAVLNKLLQAQAAETDRIIKDWAARGAELGQAGEINAALNKLLQAQAAETERIVKDWAARGVELEQAKEVNATLRELLQERAIDTERIREDWAARGAALEQVTKANAALSESLQEQTKDVQRIAKDWSARGTELEEARQANTALTSLLQEQSAHAERVSREWAARGAEIDRLVQANDILREFLQAHEIQANLVNKDWAARGTEIGQLGRANELLRKSLQEQAEYANRIGKDWAARGTQIEKLSWAVDSLEKQLQAFQSSWYGKLQRAVGKITHH